MKAIDIIGFRRYLEFRNSAKSPDQVKQYREHYLEKMEPYIAQLTEKQQKEDAKLDEKSVSAMTEELNKLMDNINCNLSFTYHKEVDVMSVKMIDKKTDEVIKEFPPEEMVESMIRAKEWIGAFLDKNA